MSKMNFWKPILIACIAGLAAAVASIGKTDKVSAINQPTGMAVASRAAPPMCPSAKNTMDKSVDAMLERYLPRTPMSQVAAR